MADKLRKFHQGPSENLVPHHTAPSKLTQSMLKLFFASLAHLTNRVSPETILEAGCGEGLLYNPSINIAQGSVYELPSGTADLAICLEVLEHLENPDLALKQLFRASKSHVILSVPREPLWSLGNLARGKYIRKFGNTRGHIQKWSKSDFVEYVSQFGEVLRVASPLPWTVVLAAS